MHTERTQFQCDYIIRFKCVIFNNKTPEGKQTVKYGKNKSIKTVPEKYKEADILDKDFKISVIKILKELKEDVEKSRK